MADEAFIGSLGNDVVDLGLCLFDDSLVAVFGAQTAGDSLDVASPCLLAREGLDADRAHEKSCTQKQRAANFRIHALFLSPFVSPFAETSGFGKPNIRVARL